MENNQSSISVLYYTEDTPQDKLGTLCKQLKEILGEETKVIALPKNFDLLIDCSADQLLNVRAMIDTALQIKLQDQSEWEEKIEDSFQNMIKTLPC